MKNILLTLRSVVLLSFILLAACKKDKGSAPAGGGLTPTTNRSELTKDSMFLYAKEIYLWNDKLESYNDFNPRGKFNSSSDNLKNLSSELFQITRHGINPLTNNFYEYNTAYPTETKYSFIDDLVAEGKLAYAKSSKNSIDFNGEGNDLGVALALVGNRQIYKLYLKFVSPGSPAALLGLKRSDAIEKINGRTIGTSYNQEVEDFVNAAFSAQSVSIAGRRSDNTTFNLTLTKTKYTSSPIYKDTVIVNNNKKIGYLAYAKFTDDKNSFDALSNVFTKFSTAGVTDLVIDLRYNGGGFVSTAEHLLNLIAPSSINGKTMFIQAYNETMQAGKATILSHQPLRDQQGKIEYQNGRMSTYADVPYTKEKNTTVFAKEGNLENITKVIFITTDGTASAAELVINSLKPYLTVKTVGTTSYGKPVGFFPIRIDNYNIYMSSFSTTNANGEGNYFAGINPDSDKKDDVTKGFGDTSELCFASAISYIVSGNFVNSTADRKITVNGINSSESGFMIKSVFEPQTFKGMIATPKLK